MSDSTSGAGCVDIDTAIRIVSVLQHPAVGQDFAAAIAAACAELPKAGRPRAAAYLLACPELAFVRRTWEAFDAAAEKVEAARARRRGQTAGRSLPAGRSLGPWWEEEERAAEAAYLREAETHAKVRDRTADAWAAAVNGLEKLLGVPEVVEWRDGETWAVPADPGQAGG